MQTVEPTVWMLSVGMIYEAGPLCLLSLCGKGHYTKKLHLLGLLLILRCFNC